MFGLKNSLKNVFLVPMTKITAEGFDRLNAISRAIIEGRASLLPDPTAAKETRFEWPGEEKYGFKTIQLILTDLADFHITQDAIAKKYGVPKWIITNISILLSQRRGYPHPKGRSWKDPKRKTPERWAIPQKEIDHWIQKFEPLIWSNANRVFKSVGVQAIYPDAVAVADFIRDEVRWRLETFDPRKIEKGKTINNTIEARIKWGVQMTVFDLYKKVQRKKIPSRRPLYGNEPASHERHETLPEINQRLTSLGLDARQRTLVLARLARIPMKRVGQILGPISENRVSVIYSPIRRIIGEEVTRRIRTPRRFSPRP